MCGILPAGSVWSRIQPLAFSIELPRVGKHRVGGFICNRNGTAKSCAVHPAAFPA
jgi:hypothetical protein